MTVLRILRSIVEISLDLTSRHGEITVLQTDAGLTQVNNLCLGPVVVVSESLPRSSRLDSEWVGKFLVDGRGGREQRYRRGRVGERGWCERGGAIDGVRVVLDFEVGAPGDVGSMFVVGEAGDKLAKEDAAAVVA